MATKERVYIDEAFVAVADRLVLRQIPGSESAQGVFTATRELGAFAAGLGFRRGLRRPVETNGREIKLEVFSRVPSGGGDLVDALAVAATRTAAVLTPERAHERATIFEEFMNGGLEYIAGFANEGESDLDVIARLVKSEHAPEDAQKDVLDLLGGRL